MSNNNKVIIGLFILFILIVLFSSFQTVVSTQKAENTAKKLIQILPTAVPTPTPTPVPTVVPTQPPPPPPVLPQHPGFRVNVGGDD